MGDIDLLQYISRAEQGSGSGTKSPKRGIRTLSANRSSFANLLMPSYLCIFSFSHWPRVIGYLWLSFTFSNHIHSSKFNHSKICINIILVLAAPLFMHVCVHFFMTNILYIFSSSCLAGWLL